MKFIGQQLMGCLSFLHKKLISKTGEKQGGFTLVELLVVVTIVVALAAASVVSVTQFAGKGDEGAQAAELDSVQAAMDTMMADNAITAVTPRDDTTVSNATNDFSAEPTEGALISFLRNNPTNSYYCWNSTGKLVQLTAADPCPAGPY